MEVVGGVSSIIAIVDLSGKILTLCHGYITSVQGARTEIERLTLEVSVLNELLERVVIAQNSMSVDPLKQTIESCSAELRDLETRLEPKKRPLMRLVGLRALKWPFKAKEVDGVIQRLERHKATIHLFLSLEQR